MIALRKFITLTGWITPAGTRSGIWQGAPETRLLNSLAFPLLVITSFAFPVWILFNQASPTIPVISLMLYSGVVITYLLSRTRFTQAGSIILILMVVLLPVTLLLADPAAIRQNMSSLNYLAVAILLTSLLLDLRATLILLLICLVGIASFVFNPAIPAIDIFSYLIFNVFMGFLTVIATLVRKSYEHQLRQSSARYHALFEQQHDGVFILSLEGIHLEVNQRAASMLGYTTDELLSMKTGNLSAEPEQSSGIQRRLLQGERIPVYERLFRRKDGSIFPVEISAELVRDEWGQPAYIRSVVRDISRRKAIENALRLSEERYRMISELISEYAFAYRVEPDNTIVREWATASFSRLTGYGHDDLETMDTFALYRPQDQERVRNDIAAVINGSEVQGEYEITTASGENRWLQIYRRPVWDRQEQRVIRFYGVAQDITERKETEAIMLEQERLMMVLKKEQEWNTAIQRMMKVLSHELRTPLTVINTSTEFLKRMTPDQPMAQERVALIQNQVQRTVQMLDEVIEVVKGTNRVLFQPRVIHMEQLCMVSLNEMQMTVGAHHRLVFISDHRVNQVRADETLISRVLVNLLSNAIKYSPQGSEIRLELRRENGTVLLEISDQGMGINEEDLPYIFDTFFRTADTSGIGGIGLGLSIVKDCVELHNGSITVRSEPGKGSTFTVRLPLPPVDARQPAPA